MPTPAAEAVPYDVPDEFETLDDIDVSSGATGQRAKQQAYYESEIRRIAAAPSGGIISFPVGIDSQKNVVDSANPLSARGVKASLAAAIKRLKYDREAFVIDDGKRKSDGATVVFIRRAS